MQTPAEIIAEKGGSKAFAAKVNRRPGTVRAWKHHNYFPRDAWPEIIMAFPELKLQVLLKLEASRSRKESAVYSRE